MPLDFPKLKRRLFSQFAREGWLIELQERFVQAIERHQAPHAENIPKNGEWLYYVFFCRLLAALIPDREARIVDWGGLYGHVTAILREMDYNGAENYMLRQYTPEGFASLDQEFHLPIRWGEDPNCMVYSDEWADAIISSGVFEHVTEDGVGREDLVLGDLRRVLKTGGLLFIWNLPAVLSLPELLAILCRKWHHQRRYRRKAIIGLLDGAGFELIFCDRHKFLPGSLLHRLSHWLGILGLIRLDDRLAHLFPFSLLARDFLIVARKRT